MESHLARLAQVLHPKAADLVVVGLLAPRAANCDDLCTRVCVSGGGSGFQSTLLQTIQVAK